MHEGMQTDLLLYKAEYFPGQWWWSLPIALLPLDFLAEFKTGPVRELMMDTHSSFLLSLGAGI
jgi:hypothetical protein